MPDRIPEFQTLVLDSFNFLGRDYGFAHQVLAPGAGALLIRYETSSVFVNLTYGPPAYDHGIGMAFGRLGIDDQPGAYSFEVGDLIQADAFRAWKWDREFTDPLVATVVGFAQFLRHCGPACLHADSSLFQEMKARRDKAIASWRVAERAK